MKAPSFDSGALAANRYDTAGLEFAAVLGTFTLQSEMFLSSLNFTNGTSANLNGMYVHGSYFLTGENRIYERYGVVLISVEKRVSVLQYATPEPG